MIPDATLVAEEAGTLMEGGTQVSSSFMDNLPDAMKLDIGTLLFVIVLVTCLFFFLKYVCFRPIIKIMDKREEDIKCGAAKLSEAVLLVEQRQSDYAASLRELRIKALEHRRSLSISTVRTKQDLLDQARQDSHEQLKVAATELGILKAAAKAELMTHVDDLSESMIKHLLRQA